MAAEWQTPIDELTGLPWLLYPPEYPLPASRSEIADDNHSFHPSTHPTLTGSLAGVALRASRVQRTDWWDHHIIYHGYYTGPQLPESEHAIFQTIVFAAAGYIPDMAIDCRGYKPVHRQMDPAAKQRLWKSGEVRVHRPGVVRNFLADYLLQQDISHVSEGKIDEFLHTNNSAKRKFLGNWLLSQAAEVAVEPFSNGFMIAKQTLRIAPHAVSKKPENFVTQTFGNGYERNHVIKLLHVTLMNAA